MLTPLYNWLLCIYLDALERKMVSFLRRKMCRISYERNTSSSIIMAISSELFSQMTHFFRIILAMWVDWIFVAKYAELRNRKYCIRPDLNQLRMKCNKITHNFPMSVLFGYQFIVRVMSSSTMIPCRFSFSSWYFEKAQTKYEATVWHTMRGKNRFETVAITVQEHWHHRQKYHSSKIYQSCLPATTLHIQL